MTILGNVFLSLAALIYLVPLQFILRDESSRRNDGGLLWATVFFIGPLWLLIGAAMGIATARGGTDWLPVGRGAQYLVVIVAAISLMVTSGVSMVGKFENPAQMPAGTPLLAGWAVRVFPLIALVFCALALNPRLAESVPPLVVRVPMIIASVVSGFVAAFLLFALLTHLQAQQTVRVESEIAFHDKRDRDMLARVESLNSEEGFVELLGFANRFEKEHIRALAIQKAQSHPHFTERLVEVLSGGWAEKGLVYLDACDAPDPQALAEPIRKAILTLAADARESMKSYVLYADQFDWNTRLILSVAEKYRGRGVDYLPAIREFRAALDTPRTPKLEIHAIPTLDAWLKKQGKGG